MITQELVGFIKQQLQEGKSKEQIANILTPHGWELADINAVFAQLLPTAAPVVPPQAVFPSQPAMQQSNQSAAPMMAQQFSPQTSTQSSTSARSQSPVIQQPAGFMSSFKNPSALATGITIVLCSIASTLVMYYVTISSAAYSMMPQSQFPTAIDQNSMIAGILAGTLVTIILSGLITKLVTKILSIEPRTFAQAFTFSASALVISSLLYLTTVVGVPAVVPAVVGIIVWVLWFWYYYSTGIGKAIGAFFINLIVGAVIGGLLVMGAIGLGVGMVATLFSGFNQPQNGIGGTSIPMVDLTNEVPILETASTTEMLVIPEGITSLIDSGTSSNSDMSTTTSMAIEGLAADAGLTTKTNPDYTHVKDSLPVGFPLPKEEERIITAAVLSANTYEGIRYILEYTSTNSLAYLRNNIKTALEKAGYSYSINEKDLNHRVITGTQVVRGSVRSFRIELKQVGTTDATVKVVFSQ